tara:strand:- start:1439 stop:1597 length:159 start_codon:yes stop_codon:yes gene_type:complete
MKKKAEKKPELTVDELLKKYREMAAIHNKVLDMIEKSALEIVIFCKQNKISV